MSILLNKSKNYIINGALDWWQRGTTNTAVTSGTYIADRVQYIKVGTAVHTTDRDTDVPTVAQSGFPFAYSCKTTLTTPQASMSASHIIGLLLRLEGQVVAPIYKKKCTLAFWVKATLPGTYPVAIRNGTNARCYVSTYTIAQSNTWERKTISFTHDQSGTWSTGNGIGILVNFNLANGTDYNAPTLNTWLDGQFSGHASCVNGVQTGSTDFKITGLQLEEGESASNFERAGGSLAEEYRLCQRYFKYFISGTNYPQNLVGSGVGGSEIRFNFREFTSDMRVLSATITTNLEGSTTVVRYDGTAVTGFPASHNQALDGSGRLSVTGLTGVVGNALYKMNQSFILDAEL